MVLKYNKETERYNDFHCGECFKIKVNDNFYSHCPYSPFLLELVLLAHLLLASIPLL